jgi:hypothetical protein
MVAALLAVLSFASVSSASEQPTAIHYYVAFKAGRLAPGLTVIKSVRGSCWEESVLETRRYAWRCLSGNFIYDPCFSASSRGRVVVCPEYAWSRRVRVMRLTQSLPRWHDYERTRFTPWGIWTTTGKRCFLLSHWQGRVAGKPQSYNCVGGGVLAGFADRRRPTWKIYYAPSWRSKRVTLVAITDAWW